ncbi:hypothetical protein Hypma_004927 [Hypsizygus marmoreus]|uniref:F-box domain-containing protein n=1 Tax=Hypsizygus marmoreus TaxID=39966 RepID=A0A369KE25_HYPMA|nr:hypothetical protein Hypma_004927 [Hypsizygus marmoreus]
MNSLYDNEEEFMVNESLMKVKRDERETAFAEWKPGRGLPEPGLERSVSSNKVCSKFNVQRSTTFNAQIQLDHTPIQFSPIHSPESVPKMSIESQVPVLVDDILLKILTHCDICSALRASQVSWHLYGLVFSREIWLALISDLLRRSFIDLPPHKDLKTLTTQSLIDLVKHIVLGPRTWKTTTTSPSEPSPMHQIILKPSPGSQITWENKPQLLSGSEFLLFQKDATLECWSTMSLQKIWEYAAKYDLYTVTSFTAEMTDDRRGIVMLIGLHVMTDETLVWKNIVELVHLDLETVVSNTLLEERVPDTQLHTGLSHFKVLGDYAVASSKSAQWITVFKCSTLLKRTFRTRRNLQVSPMSQHQNTPILRLLPYDLDLIPGHLVMVSNSIEDPLRVFFLQIWSLETLVETSCNDLSIDTIAPSLTVQINLPTPSPNLKLHVSSHLSPLRTDSSIIWMLISSPNFALVHKYHVSHMRSEPLAIQRVKSWIRTGSFDFLRYLSTISYAGYVSLDRLYNVSTPDVVSTAIECLYGGHHTFMSAYGGVLAYPEHENIIVDYYE